jgi:hypothetical protein
MIRHLQKRFSTFPEVNTIRERLDFFKSDEDQRGRRFAEHPIIGVNGAVRPQLFKRTPSDSEVNLHPDRQARALIVEFEDGATEGIIVADLGLAQSSFLLTGPVIQEFLRAAIDFYDRCDYLYWEDVEQALHLGLDS